MKKYLRNIKYWFFLFLIVLFASAGCASTKKNPWAAKRSSASHVNAPQLGRNKYYFSVKYQKKLQKNRKKR